MNIKGYDIISLVGCDHGHVAVLNNNSTHYLVVELQTEGTDFADECFRMHMNPDGRYVTSYPYGDAIAVSAREAYRSAMQKAVNIAMENTSDSE